MTEDRFRKIVAVLIAVVTAIIAVVTYLQSDAGARDDAANRDTKRYSLEAFGRQVSGDARVNYDYNSAYQAYYELDILAVSAANAGDEAAAARYDFLRDQMTALSPMLAPPYFDPNTGEVNVAKYEADTYLVETTALAERFSAASSVKDAWDSKSNTYIVHLTLLAVALFLYGLSTTVSATLTRWVFAGVGTAVALVATVWAAVVFVAPVPDLRDCKTNDGRAAIDAYANGVGLAYQNQYQSAVAEFDLALACAPNYTNALNARAQSQAALGNYESAAADYEAARASGDASASTAGELAWVYYLLGRFDDAAAMNRTALAADPTVLWVQYDLALSLLASGNVDEAGAEYTNGMSAAAKQVADAKAAGQEPSSELWWSLEDAALGLDSILFTLDTNGGPPSADSISDPSAVREAAADLSAQLKGFSVALEYTGQPPLGALAASISPFIFAEPLYDAQGNFADYSVAESFEYGTSAVSVLFDYDAMQDGQDVVFKVYVDGEEDPSWRLIDQWSLGASGTAEKPLGFEYSYASIFRPGFYTIEMYVNSHLAQTGSFVIEGP